MNGVNWYLFADTARPAAANMAVDEVLLEQARQIGKPLLRVYSWAEPAATFGYFQKYAEVERWTPLRPLIRRPTGGGLVPHDRDWTYSLIFPPDTEWYNLKAKQSYERVHNWVRAAFKAANIEATVAATTQGGGQGQCFAGAEQFDVLWQDQKIAGGAQRRNKQGLLIQGSIQPPPTASRSTWEAGFLQTATREWHVEWIPFALSSDMQHRVEALVASKYAHREYNERR